MIESYFAFRDMVGGLALGICQALIAVGWPRGAMVSRPCFPTFSGELLLGL